MVKPDVLAFDLYGTLVDPIRIWQHLDDYLPGAALGVAELWRQKQLEFTFRLSMMERYENFEIVTRKALEHALAAAHQTLAPQAIDALMTQYNDLEPFPDVLPGLEQLRRHGYPMVIFSNGTPSMVAAVVGRGELRRYFGELVSVDAVAVYKPSPRVYRYLADRVQRPIHEVRLISSNPFDLIGAEAAGMPAVWLDRSGGLFDPLGPQPGLVVRTVVELAETLTRAI